MNAALVALFRYRELLEQAACVMGKLQVQLDEQPAYAATAALQSYSRLGLPAGLDQRLDLLVINAELAAQARQNDQTYAMTVDSYCHLVGL